MNKVNLMKIKNCCSTKNTVKKNEKLSNRLGEKFCKTNLEKELISRLHKELKGSFTWNFYNPLI